MLLYVRCCIKKSPSCEITFFLELVASICEFMTELVMNRNAYLFPVTKSGFARASTATIIAYTRLSLQSGA